MRTAICAIVAFLTVLVMPVLAHHTISAVYDTNKVVTLNGVVTEVDWQNPHVILHLDAKNDDGTLVSWDVETWHLQGMRRRGLNQDFVKVGEAVSMNVFVARDGARKAALDSIELPSGTLYISLLPSSSQPSVTR
jgi:hypothetical protein